MNRILPIFLACASLLLSACALERPLARPETLTAIGRDLGVSPSTVRAYAICFHVVSAHGAHSGSWNSALYVRTNDRVLIADRDANSARLTLVASLPLADLTSVGFHTVGTRAQLQLGLSASLHGIVLLQDGGGRLDYTASEEEWRFLRSLPVKVVAAPPNIENSARGPMYVPIVVK